MTSNQSKKGPVLEFQMVGTAWIPATPPDCPHNVDTTAARTSVEDGKRRGGNIMLSFLTNKLLGEDGLPII